MDSSPPVEPCPPVPAFALAYSSKKSANAENWADLRSGESPTSSKKNTRSTNYSNNRNEPPSLILDFLYLGGVNDARDAVFLESNNVKYIINVSTEEYWSVNKDIVVYPFRVEDNVDANIAQYFRSTDEVLEKVRKEFFAAKREDPTLTPPRVLVHCQKGKSRSATIVLAYLISRNGWTLNEALDYVKAKRPCIEPNIGFLGALHVLEDSVSTEQRSKKSSEESIIVRNISCHTSKNAIKSFFEKHIGCVKKVVIHHRDHPSNGKQESEPKSDPEADCTLCMVFFACSENAKRAKHFANSSPRDLDGLRPVKGKTIKLSLPSKIKTINDGFASSAA
ncbi:protein-tyrosine phosphatase [Angomonas deanei]|uniref:protein-tyrosine-phosphatase n=1 Tax=Angomonas deanei TaxID=59799 RepID=A0A7G2CC45_9TRYP|nr:protein-tyrosine phosphatase [Angomonas deanei]CAD2217015.1 Dual specificity phosphatase, catalytic domain containing protein, putative [Angomonas deanei]|eukprot:EPY35125.1 protein-tyrosine phosphatase [Angomonas deanei]